MQRRGTRADRGATGRPHRPCAAARRRSHGPRRRRRVCEASTIFASTAEFDLAKVVKRLEAHGVAVGERGRRYGASGFDSRSIAPGNGLKLRS
jgi:hypothetical protein